MFFSIYIFSFAVCFFLYTYSVLQYVFSIYIFSFTTCLFHIHSQSCDLSLRLSVKLRIFFCSLCLFRFAIFIGVLFSFVYDKTESAKEAKDNRKTEYEYISLQEIAQNWVVVRHKHITKLNKTHLNIVKLNRYIRHCDIFCVLRLFGFAILLCVLYTYSVLQYLDVSYSVLWYVCVTKKDIQTTHNDIL
jgi:hypothetical protein